MEIHVLKQNKKHWEFVCGYVLKPGVGLERNNHSDFYKVFSKVMLPNDNEK